MNEKNQLLALLSQNKVYDIVENILQEMYFDERENFFKDYNVFFHLLDKFSLEEKEKFTTLIINNFPEEKNIDLTKLDEENYKKIKKFWKLKKEKEIPLVFGLCVFLNDKQIAKILEDNYFSFSTNKISPEMAKKIIICLAENQYIETLMFLKEKHQIDYRLDLYKDNKFKELLIEKGNKNIALIPFVSKMLYEDYFDTLENILRKKMDENTFLSEQENQLFQKEILKNYQKFLKETTLKSFEKLLSTLTYASNDYYQTKNWIHNNILEYQGKKIPLWVMGHTNAKKVTKEMMEEIDIFEYCESLNKVFIDNIITLKEYENETSIFSIFSFSKKDWIEKLLSEKDVLGKKRNIYTILINSDSSYTLVQNLLVTLNDYTNFLKNKNYEDLEIKEKEEIIINYVHHFLFQETFKSKDDKKEFNMSTIFYKFYSKQELEIIKILLEHLKLLANKKEEKEQYIIQYKESLLKVMNSYYFRKSDDENERYNFLLSIVNYMVDFPKTIEEIYQITSQKDLSDYSDTAKKVFKLIDFIYLDNDIEKTKISQKKLKI
jgi:hypothetical protein